MAGRGFDHQSVRVEPECFGCKHVALVHICDDQHAVTMKEVMDDELQVRLLFQRLGPIGPQRRFAVQFAISNQPHGFMRAKNHILGVVRQDVVNVVAVPS